MPVSLRIDGRNILVVGGGRLALHKTALIARFTPRITVVAPRFDDGFRHTTFTLRHKEYSPDDLRDIFLVYACTDSDALNARIRDDAAAQGILASVCDNPERCDFISPAIYINNNVTVSVSSDARRVRQSVRIRDDIRRLAEQGLLRISEDDTLPTDQ
jgi:siroheme synthase-like protein